MAANAPNLNAFKSISVQYFLAQKISPDTKEKVQLQLIMHDGGANTFQFNNPGGRSSQMADRDSVKELLLQLLPKFRRKLSSELEEKNRYITFLAFFILWLDSFFSQFSITHTNLKKNYVASL